MIKNIYKINIEGVSYGIIDSNNIARIEESDLSSTVYQTGDYLIWYQKLYRVIKDINIRDQLKVNTNLTETTVMDEIKPVNPQSINSKLNGIESSIATIDDSVSNAKYPHKTGEYIIWYDTLYEVIKDIPVGQQLSVGDNLKHINIISKIRDVQNDTNDKLNTKLNISQGDDKIYGILITNGSGNITVLSQLTGNRLMMTSGSGEPVVLPSSNNSIIYHNANGIPTIKTLEANQPMFTDAAGIPITMPFSPPTLDGLNPISNGQIYEALGNRTKLDIQHLINDNVTDISITNNDSGSSLREFHNESKEVSFTVSSDLDLKDYYVIPVILKASYDVKIDANTYSSDNDPHMGRGMLMNFDSVLSTDRHRIKVIVTTLNDYIYTLKGVAYNILLISK